MKVIYVTNLPSPYRIDFFNELSKNIELTVIYERETAGNRDAAWKNTKVRTFRETFCHARSFGNERSISCDLVKEIKRNTFDILVISGYSSPSVMMLIAYCRMKHIEYFIETDGGFNKKDNFIKASLKKSLIKKAAGIFTTCDELIAYFRSLGYNGRIIKYPFSSIKEEDIFNRPSDESEKNTLKAKLGIREPYVVISVGRFSYQNGYGKGYDAVVRAAEKLRSFHIGWYIIGGKPTEEFEAIVSAKQLDNVHFIDFKKRDELFEYYRASDISVLMTVLDAWGLVINESMACGLPVITTDKCVAGIEMIENGANGYIIPVGEDEMLAAKVKFLYDNRNISADISKSNIRKSKEWTIESMAQIHYEVFMDYMNGKINEKGNCIDV